MLRMVRLALLLTVLLAVGLLLAQVPPPSRAPAKPASDEEIEEVEDVAVVPVSTPASAEIDARRGGFEDIAGRFHNAVVHLPIGWLLMTLLLDVLALILRRKELEASGLWALGGALLAFLPGITTGLLREDFVAQAPEIRSLIGTHETLIFVTAGVAVAAFLWRLAFRRKLNGAAKGVYLTLITGACLLIATAGHWGGKVAFGADYLPF